MHVFDAICSPSNLALAFKRYEKSSGLWAPGYLMADLRANKIEAMLQLADDLRSGRYTPHPPVTFEMQKGDGTRRPICVFAVRDRVVQRAALLVVQQITERHFMPSSFGFRPGGGVRRALAAATQWVSSGYGYAVDTDIRRCFEHIAHAPLIATVERMVRDRRAVELLVRCLQGCGQVGGQLLSPKQTPARGVEGLEGLAQGACLSPWFCNVYLHPFDRLMQRQKTPLVRYADDLVLFTRSHLAAVRALDSAQQWMAKHGLALHPNKTNILQPQDTARFLGQSLARPDFIAA